MQNRVSPKRRLVHIMVDRTYIAAHVSGRIPGHIGAGGSLTRGGR